MNAAQVNFQRDYDGPPDEAYFARLRALEDWPPPEPTDETLPSGERFWEREYPEGDLESILPKARAAGCRFDCPPNVECRACALKPGPSRPHWDASWPDAPGTYVKPSVIYENGAIRSVQDSDLPPDLVEFDPDLHYPAKWPQLAARASAAGKSIGKPLDVFLAESQDGIAYVVDGLIVEGGVYAAVGRPETFKSFATTHLGLAIAGAATSWLGRAIGAPRPFIYVSNEKAAATVRERFRTQAGPRPPTEAVVIIHRAGVTFGDRARWAEVTATVDANPGAFVAIDTLASLAGAGFNENDGKDMAVVLGGVRELVDHGATVLIAHHPSKFGEGTGGIRMRGHTSLWGDVDGVLEFTRPDRAVDAGMVRAEPKDGELALIPFRWNRETFLLEADDAQRFATPAVIADVVRGMFTGDPLTGDAIASKFPNHGRSAFLERLGEAVDLGLVRRAGKGKATRYTPDDSSTRVRQ